MKILMVNVTCGVGSTGRICTDLADKLIMDGHEVRIAYGRKCVPDNYLNISYKIGGIFNCFSHVLLSRINDSSGTHSIYATRRLLEYISDFNPDIIHLHNIHGYYLNYKILFEYLSGLEIPVVWTLHDCWSFTGHCAYFDYINCMRWTKSCSNCPAKKNYPKTLISNSKKNLIQKKKYFSNIPHLYIVTPSVWLSNLVKMSFLNQYPIHVIRNGINTMKFRPHKNKITQKYGIEDKKIILGVASVWDKRKGLTYFWELSKLISSDYIIVLIGLSRKQNLTNPCNILYIDRTDSIDELVEWYSSAYAYVNPTLEDNYPTTNLEACACGIPVITFNTGGSPESAASRCIVVDKSALAIWLALKNLNYEYKYVDNGLDKMYTDYLELYKSILKRNNI